MIFVYAVLLALALFNTAIANNYAPSFRSSVHENGKPILRGGGPEAVLDEDKPTFDQPPTYEAKLLDSGWVDDLRTAIEELVHQLGYEAAKPYIEKLVDNTEKNQHVLLHVEGSSKVDYKQYLRAGNNQIVWPPTPPPPPQWLSDFKSFIKNLIERYGKQHMDDHLRPVIKYVEKLNNVYIKDVDGEVMVEYEERQRV